ncbi:MAG: molybdenum cofactor guanylyltransferase [Planctomycetota bacterium]
MSMRGKESAAIILAGGRSTRMGRDKALLEAEGRRIIERQIDALREIFPRVYISAKDAGPFAGVNAQVVPDVYDDRAALVGLYSGLKASEADVNFCVACDMPVIHRPLIEEMLGRRKDYFAVVPESPRGLEPTYAVYTKACCAAAKTLIEKKQFAFTGLLSVSRALVINAEEVGKICGGVNPFLNINTPEDFDGYLNAKGDCH